MSETNEASPANASERTLSDLLGVVYCSFCGKSDKEVIAIIRADDCAICDRCVIVCMQTIIDSYGAATNNGT